MRKNKRKIIVSASFLIFAFVIIFIAEKFNIPSQTPAPSDGDISSVRLDEGTRLLKIEYVGGGSDAITLTPSSLEPEVFRLKGFGGETYLRFFSPAFYESYGQPSQGIIILTRTNPSNLTSNPHNNIASEFQAAESPTAADLGFAAMYSYLQKHNMYDRRRNSDVRPWYGRCYPFRSRCVLMLY